MSLTQIIVPLLALIGTVLLAVGYLIMGRNDWPSAEVDPDAYQKAVAQSGRAVDLMTAGGGCLAVAALIAVLMTS